MLNIISNSPDTLTFTNNKCEWPRENTTLTHDVFLSHFLSDLYLYVAIIPVKYSSDISLGSVQAAKQNILYVLALWHPLFVH